MTTNEGLSILLAIFLIVVVFRWLLGSAPAPSSQQQARRTGVGASDPSRVRPRAVTAEMIETVCTMFPNIPPAAIQYDLQKTGSVEVTCDNILQNGGLPLPPPAVIPTLSPSTSSAAVASSSSSTSATNITQQSLLHRYRLHDAASKDVVPDEPPRTWENSPEKRQQHLQKRKEAMVLQARKRFMEQQQRKEEEAVKAKAEATSPPGTSQYAATSDKLSEIENDSEQRRQQMLRAAEMRMGLSGDNTL